MTKFEDRTAAEALPGTAWLDSARGRGILGRLSDELVAALIRGAQRVEYPAGSVGLRYDETPKAAIVLNGKLRSFISYPDGSQATTRYLRAGDLTGVFAPRRPVLARGVQAIAQRTFRGRVGSQSSAEPDDQRRTACGCTNSHVLPT